MNEETTIDLEIPGHSASYKVTVGSGLLPSAGTWLRDIRAGVRRGAIISNDKVFGLYGEVIRGSLQVAGIGDEVFLMPDGEEYKTLEIAENAAAFLSEKRFGREDAVIALGGGVVGDLAGFTASIFQRGVPYFQVPTTLLAMIDSSVGGKTGVNTRFGKNLLGSFHHPSGVLADVSTLSTLEERELRSGLFEAVKQAALSGRSELEGLGAFLSENPPSAFSGREIASSQVRALVDVVSRQVQFKGGIVVNDANEQAGRVDSRSRKILNFGHTTAHALEKVTDFKRFRHGEAVAYGMVAAGELSKRLEICPESSINLLNDVVDRVGVLPAASDIAIEDVLESITFDKKSSGGAVQWILLEDIGKPVILSGQEIPQNVIRESVEYAISQRSVR